LEPGVEYQGRRDARTTTAKTVPRCSSRSVVRLGLFNARSVGEKSAAVPQWITDTKLSLAALVETWHDDASSPQLIACAPPAFKYVESARHRKGSFVSVFYSVFTGQMPSLPPNQQHQSTEGKIN